MSINGKQILRTQLISQIKKMMTDPIELQPKVRGILSKKANADLSKVASSRNGIRPQTGG